MPSLELIELAGKGALELGEAALKLNADQPLNMATIAGLGEAQLAKAMALLKLNPFAYFRAVKPTVMSGNGLGVYEDIFKIDPQFWQGDGLALDLGAGVKQNLARGVRMRAEEALKNGLPPIRTRVVSFDARLGLKAEEDLTAFNGVSAEDRLAGRISHEPLSVAAEAGVNHFPFKDGVFKRVFSLMMAPVHLKTVGELRNTYSETERVLEKGGLGEFYPVAKYGNIDHVTPTEEWMRYRGLRYELRPRNKYASVLTFEK